MGGQACILYGAAEFSRDIDIAVAVFPGNLDRLRRALRELKAETVFFPPLSAEVLQRGHACHFRCRAAGLEGIRLDVMGVMRGAEPFPKLWARRTRLRLAGVGKFSVMSLPDLVRIKKTQRDKDWPMVRRMIEADIAVHGRRPTVRQIRFWLRECRTPDLLMKLAREHPRATGKVSKERPVLKAALRGDREATVRELDREQRRESELDRKYWAPLRAELERWRLGRSGMRAHRADRGSRKAGRR